jgi:hypothetical protein
MRATRLLASPAIWMVVIAGIYTLIRVPPDNRARVFGMLAMTVVAATHVVEVVLRIAKRPRWTIEFASAAAVAGGATLMAVSMLDDLSAIPFVAGAVIFSAGLVLKRRTFIPT